MQLFDWFYRQRVTEGEMDAGFGAVNTALKTLRTTQIEGVWMGALWGDPPLAAPQTPTEHAPPNMAVDIPGPLRAWDDDGNLIYDPTIAINVNCAEDYQGTPTAVSLPANEKWVTICVAFDWDLSDPRVDGNGNTAYYQKDPSLVYEVYQGAEALIGAAVVPAIPADRVIICDVLLHWNVLTIATADLDFDRLKIERRGYDQDTVLTNNGVFTNFPTTGFSAATGPTVGGALEEIDGWMTGHLDGTGPHHDSDDIDFDNLTSGLAATDVKGALDEIDNTVDGLESISAFWDTDVRFSGLMVEPTGVQAPVNGEIGLWNTAGQLYVRGTVGAGATTYSTLAFLPTADGGLALTQANNAANTGIFFDVQADSGSYAARISNLFDDSGTPNGLSVHVNTPVDASVGIYTRMDLGTGHEVRIGGATAMNPIGLLVDNWGAAAAKDVYGVKVVDRAVAFAACANGFGLAVETQSADYTTASYGAWLENKDVGANGYQALHLLPKDGTGIYADVEGGAFFDVTVSAAGNLGALRAGTVGIGGLALKTVNGTGYGLQIYPDNSLDTYTALVGLIQTGTGLMLSGLMAPAQDSIVLTSSVVAGDSTKAGIKVDYSNCDANNPVPFWGVSNTNGGYAFFAERGLFAAKSPMGTDVFTFGPQDAEAWDKQQWQALLNGSPTGIACDYVELARDVEVPTAVLSRDHLSRRRIATAWAQCAAAGGITGGHFNVLSVTRTAVGIYSIVLDVDQDGVGMTGRAVVVTPSSRGVATDMMSATVVDPLTNPIVVHLQHVVDPGTVSRTDEDFSFVVFQDQ